MTAHFYPRHPNPFDEMVLAFALAASGLMVAFVIATALGAGGGA